MPDAAQRILDHYTPSAKMPPLDLVNLLRLDAPYNHRQPEERIKLSASDTIDMTLTEIGPDGRPIYHRTITGVRAIGGVGTLRIRVDDQLRLTGVKATAGIGTFPVVKTASAYGRSGYGVHTYTTK
jgi:hypothetical protein